jgi:hypothetical protein
MAIVSAPQATIHRKEIHVRRTITIALALAMVSTAASGCASSGATANAKVTESSPDRITSAEIEATSGAQNAYDLVRRLRPRWLQAGATGSIGSGISRQSLLVYLDGNRLGVAPDALRTLSASGIKTMQYYDAVRASTVLSEIGSDPISGAIVITTMH